MTERRIDSSGRRQPVRKTTLVEIDRRSGWIVLLWRRGHNTVEIAAALDVSPSVVSQQLCELLPNRPRRMVGRGVPEGSYPWRDEDMPEPVISPGTETRWRQSRIVGMAQMLNDEYRESSFANVLANQATEAAEAGDQAWLLEAQAVIAAAIEKLERARRVLTDEHYRAECRDTLEGVELMRSKSSQLKVVG